MKKLLITAIALCMGVNSVFAAYQPSMEETKQVEMAWDLLLQIVETKLNANYELLLGLLNNFQTKVAGDERKEWILETLIWLTNDKMWMQMDDTMMDDTSNDPMMDDEMMKTLTELVNVTNGAPIRGIAYNGSETWRASIKFDGTSTIVYAEFDNLPDPGADNFYEGWIVRQNGWFNFFSTGELIIENGKWVNTRSIDWNHTDHIQYVLTLEPNDNDPAPADHIIEGDVEITS